MARLAKSNGNIITIDHCSVIEMKTLLSGMRFRMSMLENQPSLRLLAQECHLLEAKIGTLLARLAM